MAVDVWQSSFGSVREEIILLTRLWVGLTISISCEVDWRLFVPSVVSEVTPTL
jgi:hypothetical protein